MKLSDKIQSFLEQVGVLSTPSTVENYRLRLDQLNQFLGEQDCTEPAIDRWTRHLMHERHLSNDTVNQYRKTALQFLNGVVRKEHFSLESAPRERGIFTDEELDLIQCFAGDQWRTAIKVARASAMRLGDVAMLRWDKTDLEAGSIAVVPIKTKKKGRKGIIPLDSNLTALLKHLKASSTSEFVLPELAVHYQYDQHKTLSVQFIRLANKAGVTGKSFHLIRNTVITKWLASGISAEQISMVTGQSINQIMKYHRVTVDDLKKIFFK